MSEKETPTKEELIPVLVTTTDRGIYFGYARGLGRTAKCRKSLYYAKHCYWYAKGPHGGGTYDLAVSGPHIGSTVGPEVPAAVIGDVANVVRCTAAAARAWEVAKWDEQD